MKRFGIALLLGICSPLTLAGGNELAPSDNSSTGRDKRPNTPTIAADAAQTWRNECGRCHMAFPPGLLPGKAWGVHMDTLNNHFGRNASLGPREEQEIREFLMLVSSNNPLPVEGVISADEQPRITQTNWFKRQHRKVDAETFTQGSVRAPANCAGCHGDIERGSYRRARVRR